MSRVFSGIQPTSNLTLGNYLGAIKNWVGLKEGHESSLYCVVDLHALTVPQDPEKLRKQTRETAAAYFACGIDYTNSIVFHQSAVAGHSELSWLLGCLTPLGWLNRMTQFKDKAGKKKDQASLGLYGYPTLMAADILLYKATHVPVGDDQKQHVELARDIAGAFNARYEKEFFPLPEPQILGDATRVMSLRDGTNKMSKSDPSDYSRINLTDEDDVIALKIKKAKTDPESLPSELSGFEGRPEAKNLMTIYAALEGKELSQICTEFGGKPFSEFKPVLSDRIIESLSPVREKMKEFMKDQVELDNILKTGAEKAADIAMKNMHDVRDIMGLLQV